MSVSRGLLAVAVVCCSLLLACNGGGGGTTTLRFETYNVSGCATFVADVDLAAGNSVVARRSDGSFDCALDPVLAEEGCDAAFEEQPDGHTLRVTIDGCQVPPITRLFECGFSSADVASLKHATDSRCFCSEEPVCHYNSVCDQDPAVCITEEGAPGACEICDNSVDDDGDGEVDCNDTDCEITDVCGWGWTTITCPSSTTLAPTTTLNTTTTTVAGPTTTLGPPRDRTYAALFRLESSTAAVGALQWTTGYASATGEFVGAGPMVSCTNKVPGALFAPNDSDAGHKLTLGLIALTSFAAPIDLVECSFLGSSSDAPTPEEFPITIDDATDGEGAPISATIGVTFTEDGTPID